jgi:hypothetical protein
LGRACLAIAPCTAAGSRACSTHTTALLLCSPLPNYCSPTLSAFSAPAPFSACHAGLATARATAGGRVRAGAV